MAYAVLYAKRLMGKLKRLDGQCERRYSIYERIERDKKGN